MQVNRSIDSLESIPKLKCQDQLCLKVALSKGMNTHKIQTGIVTPSPQPSNLVFNFNACVLNGPCAGSTAIPPPGLVS